MDNSTNAEEAPPLVLNATTNNKIETDDSPNHSQKRPFLPSVYAESEIVVDEEPPTDGDSDDDDNDDDDDDNDDDDDDDEIEQRPTMFPSSTLANEDGHDSDEDLEQEDLNEMVTGTKLDQTTTKDPVTKAFHKRIRNRKVPEQCLRYTMEWRRRYDRPDSSSNHQEPADSYAVDSQPLWIRSDRQPSEIPSCPYCHAPRAFEFQLMPQMLHFLHTQHQQPHDNSSLSDQAKKNETAKQALMAAQSIIDNSEPSQIPPSFADAKAKAMQALKQDLVQQDRVDWGVVAIYTCTASCSGTETAHVDPQLGPAYREEYAWLQPALDI
jgi:hypothetical protein